jgi:hypothetical protein
MCLAKSGGTARLAWGVRPSEVARIGKLTATKAVHHGPPPKRTDPTGTKPYSLY